MTVDDMLHRIMQQQAANGSEPVDGFGCSDEEAALVRELSARGLVRFRSVKPLLDGPLYNGLTLTRRGLLEWQRLHPKRDRPSG